MNKNENVFIRPSKSLRFAGRWGLITEVDFDNGLPYKIAFRNEEIEYSFFEDELIDEKSFFEWLKVGSEALLVWNGKEIIISDRQFPYLYTADENYKIHFMNVVPISYCTCCNKKMFAAFSNECESCKYGGIIDGES